MSSKAKRRIRAPKRYAPISSNRAQVLKRHNPPHMESTGVMNKEIEMNADAEPKHEYHLIVDQQPKTWPNPTINGLDIKKLAGLPPAEFSQYEVFQVVKDHDDIPIADEQPVNLAGPGIEKFFTNKPESTPGDGNDKA